MLIDGQVSIRNKEINRNSGEIAQLKRGDIFGEMTVFAGTPRSATIQSIGKMDVLEINRQSISELIEEEPESIESFGHLNQCSPSPARSTQAPIESNNET